MPAASAQTQSRPRTNRRAHAADDPIRRQVVEALEAGEKPLDIAARLGIHSQWVWNIRTSQERLKDRSVHHHMRHRTCLGCGISFLSWGAGNRRCRLCAQTLDSAGPYEASFSSRIQIR